MSAAMMRSTSSVRTAGVPSASGRALIAPLLARRASVVARAENQGRDAGSKISSKVSEGADAVGEAARNVVDKGSNASSGKSTTLLEDTPIAKAIRGVEDNHRQQWQQPPPPETQTPGAIFPAFTRNREVNAGRLAMIGFLAAYVGEIGTVGHLGPIGQVSAWSGISPGAVGAAIIGLITFNLLGGVLPWSATFDDRVQRDNAKRNPGPPQGDLGDSPKGFLNITDLGFTKQNELFNGRMAQLGFLAALAGEVAAGNGPIGQVAKYLDIPVNDELYANAKVLLGLWTLFLLGSAAVTGNWGQKVPGDERIY